MAEDPKKIMTSYGMEVPPPPKKNVPEKPPQPETFKADNVNIANQVIPIEQQGEEGEFSDYVGYDVEMMNVPAQFIEFDEEGNAVPEEEQPAREATKLEEIHNKYLGDKSYQEMVYSADRKAQQLKSYDPNTMTHKMGEMVQSGDLGKMNEIEKESYMQSYLLSQNLVGKGSAFITGIINSAMDPSKSPTEHYQDIMQGHASNLTKYNPNLVQTIFLDAANLGVEMPLFNAFGGAYRAFASPASVKYAAEYAKDLGIRGGLSPALSERYALNTITAIDRAYQSGTVLGAHAGLTDISQQIADGATLATLDWDQTIGAGNQSFAIGAGIGFVGFGGQFLKNSVARTKIADMHVARRMANMGINAGAFTGEVSVFTYGDALLNADVSHKDVDIQDWIHNSGIILSLRGMHMRVGNKMPKKLGTFSPEEGALLNKHVKLDVKQDPIQQIMKAEKGLEKVMTDPEIPQSTRQKIADRFGMTLESGPISNVQYRETPDGKFEVRSFDGGGNLLEYKVYSDKATALRTYDVLDRHRVEVGNIMELSKMTPESRLNIAERLRNKGLEKEFFDETLTDALMKPQQSRTKEESKAVNNLMESLSEFRLEQKEAAQGAQKAAEGTGKKMAEDSRGEITKAIEEMRNRVPYTERDANLAFKQRMELRADLEHPGYGVDKLLKDIAEIQRSGNFTDASIKSKVLENMLNIPGGEVKIRSQKQLNEIETQLENLKGDIKSELQNRKGTKAKQGEGQFTIGPRSFETKQELFRELDRVPSLDKLPVRDYKTEQAIQEYKNIQSTRAKEYLPKEPTSFERTSENLKTMAERVRKAKGKLDPKPGTLQVRVPYIEKGWDGAVEVMAKSLEGGAKFVESIEKAVEYIRTTDVYKNLTRPQQVQAEQGLREALGKYTDEQIAELTKAHGRAKEYTKNIDRLKKEKPEEYWSVDRPTDKQIVEAAEQGRLIEVEGGAGIVAKDGEIIGLIKTDPAARGVAKAVLDKAVEMGGNKLNAFSGYLTDLYAKNGFTTVAKVPFDPKYAPKDAPKENLPEFVEYMVRDTGKKLPKEMLGKEFMNPTEAEAYWNKATKMVETPKEPVKRKPKTTTQKKIDSQFQRERNKILVDEYAALKDQIRVEGKSAREIQKNAKEAKETFNEFISGQAWQGTMDKRAAKAIWRRINNMDFTKPGTIAEAKAYVERAVKDANFRYELAEFEAAYTKLDKFSDPKNFQTRDKVRRGKGVSVEAQDQIKRIRDRMLKEDPLKAQKEIDEIMAKAEAEDRHFTMEEYNRIEELSFNGLLRPDHPGDSRYYNARVQDLKDITRQGRTQQKAKVMFRQEQKAYRYDNGMEIMTGQGRKPVELDAKYSNSVVVSDYKKAMRKFDWVQQDSWFSLMDKLSRFDRTSAPMESWMNLEWGGRLMDAERNNFVSKQETLTKLQNDIKNIFKLDGKALEKKLNDWSSERIEIKWEGKDGKPAKPFNWTMSEIYKKWAELQDPSLIRSHMNDGFFDAKGNKTKQYQALEKALTPEAKAMAEYQLKELYPYLYEVYNPVYRDIYGTDMPYNSMFTPISVADKPLSGKDAVNSMIESTSITGLAGNNHMIARTNHSKKLSVLDGNSALINYIEKMEHFKAYGELVRDMNSFFKNPDIRATIEQNFGSGYNEMISKFTDKFANRYIADQTKLERNLTEWRGRFTVGSLALKPAIAMKQLTSIPAYLEHIGIKDFSAGVLDYVKNFDQATKTLNEIPYMQERYMKGWDRDIQVAMKKDANALLSKGKNSSFTDYMMFMVKWGDKAAIQVGGWPIYKKTYDNAIKSGRVEEAARMEAERAFVKATRNSQQATGLGDLSYVQTAHPMYKLLTMYKTSPLQYHRKAAEGVRNIYYGRGSTLTNAKKTFIYHALLPSIFQLVGNGFTWDGEDQLRAAVMGNFNALFMVGDAASHLADKIQDKPFDYNITPMETLVGDAAMTPREVKELLYLMENPENVTVGDFFDATRGLTDLASRLTGVGAAGVHNTLHGIVDAVEGNTQFPVRRILGTREAAMEDNVDLLNTFNRNDAKLFNDKFTPVSEIKRQHEVRNSKGRKVPPPPSK